MLEWTNLMSLIRRSYVIYMRRTTLCLLLGFFPLIVPQSVGAQLSNTKRDELKRQVTKIITDEEIGGGIVLSIGGRTAFVLTAYHVVKDAKEIRVAFFERKYQEFTAKISKFDDGLDIAVVRIDDVPFADSSPSLTVVTDPPEGTPVLTLGHPADLDWQFQKAEISRLAFQGDVRRLLHSSLNLRRGDSGGAVFVDSDGGLVGIVTGRGPSGYATDVAISPILPLIQRDWGIPTTNLAHRNSTLKSDSKDSPSTSIPTTENLCGRLRKLTDYGAGGFRSIIGKAYSPYSFESTFDLPNAGAGLVDPDESVFYIMFESEKIQDVDAKYYNLTDSVKTCFVGWQIKEFGEEPDSEVTARKSFAIRQNAKGPVIKVGILERKSWKSTLYLEVYAPGKFHSW